MPQEKWIGRDEWVALAAKGEAPPEACLRKVYEVDEIRQADGDGRRIQFTISTESVDRDRDVIQVDGWDLKAFKRAGVVLWAHDYYSLPIARPVKVWAEDGKLKSVAEFAPAEIYPFAETVFQMLKAGFLKSASVGFRPKKWNYNEERRGTDFVEQELLEFSVVPVPANPEALVDAKASGIDVEPLRAWAKAILDSGRDKGVSPADVSSRTADEGTAWEAPTLGDFTSEQWGDVSASERRRIAGHYAWAAEMPPETFGSLKLPHHRPSDGAVVWRGVANAAARLSQSSIPDGDLGAVRRHLARHYRQFDKVPPWEAEELSQDLARVRQILAAETEAEQKQFEIQSVLFPKSKWSSAEACRGWLRDHDLKTGGLDETEDHYRFRQRDPADFQRMRTICLAPNRDTPLDDCRVKAVGGPLKAVEEAIDLDAISCEDEEFDAADVVAALREVIASEASAGTTSAVRIALGKID